MKNIINKATKISGYMLIIAGLLCILSIAFKPVVSIIVIGAVILFSKFIYLYVYFKSRK